MKTRCSVLRLVAACLCAGVLTTATFGQSRGEGGACCYPDGTCVDNLMQGSCEDTGGAYQGDNTICDQVPGGVQCIPVGGCCMPDGNCVPGLTQDECESQNYLWFGAGTDCTTIDCLSFAVGACCLPDGSCSSSEDMVFCEQELGGVWQGPETICSGVSCGSTVPPNDDCQNAIPITTFDLPVFGTVDGATDDFVPDCEDFRGLSTPGVWYSVIGNGAVLEASVCTLEPAARGDRSYLYVYCGGCDALQCVAGDGGTEVFSCSQANRSLDTVSWCAAPGREYLIFVALDSASTTDFMLSIIDTGKPCKAFPCGIPNDDCEDAIRLTTTDGLVVGTSQGAQFDNVPACPLADGRGIGGVWYSVIGTGNVLEVDLCSLGSDRGITAHANVYCGSCDSLQCVAANVDESFACQLAGRSDGFVSWCSEAGREYFILVAVDSDEFGIQVRDTGFDTCEPLPCGGAADFCEDAMLVCPGELYFGDTFSATSDYLDHGAPFDTIFFCGMFFGLYDVWYKYEPAEAGLLFVHVEGPPTEYVFGVYDSCSSLPEDLLACNIARHHGVVITWVQPETTYYIRIAGYATTRGEFQLDLVGPDCAEIPYNLSE